MASRDQYNKDPAHAAGERLAMLMKQGSKEGVNKQLDPTVVFHGLNNILYGQHPVTRWLVKFCELAGATCKIHSTVSSKDLKTATTVLSIHDLYLEDTVAINHSLLITKIVRRRTPCPKPQTEASRNATDAFLKSLLVGDPPRPTERWPVLDFSYKHVDRVRELAVVQPRSGKKVVKREEPVEEKAVEEKLPDPVASTQQMVIKGKSRDGEQAAYTFEKEEPNTEKEETADSDDEDLGFNREGLGMYETPAIKLCNNNLTSPFRLDEALKRLCCNAFYYLTWVDLSFNKLSAIPDLSQFPIVILYLHANNIRNVNEDQVAHYKYTALNILHEKEQPWTLKKFDFAVLSSTDYGNMKTLRDFTNGSPPGLSDADVDEALLAWLNLFESGRDVASFCELCDGLVLAKVFAEMHPTHAIDTARLSATQNWFLKQGNLDEIVGALSQVYKKFKTEVDIVQLVKTDAIAANSDEAAVKELVKFMLTSVFASTRAATLGEEIVSLQSDDEKSHVPDTLMLVMKSIQDEHDLDLSDLVDDEDSPTPGAKPRHLFNDPPSFHHDPYITRTAADYEEEIAELKTQLNEQITTLVEANEHLAGQKDAVEQKYQALMDKQFSNEKPPSRDDQNAPRLVAEKLSQELTERDRRIADLERKLQDFRAREEEWQQTQDELHIALSEVSEARKEAEKVEQIREQRERVAKERNFYKTNTEALEKKLDEEVEKNAKLQGQMDRAAQKVKKADSIIAEKTVLGAKLTDALQRLADAQEQLAPVKQELATSQRMVRQAKVENQALKEELEIVRESLHGDSATLADELTGATGRERDERHQAKKENLSLKEDLKEKSDEIERLQTENADLAATNTSLERQVRALNQQLADAEATLTAEVQMAQKSTLSNEKIARLEEELKLKIEESEVVQDELADRKEELVDLKLAQMQECKSLQKRVDSLEIKRTMEQDRADELQKKLEVQREEFERHTAKQAERLAAAQQSVALAKSGRGSAAGALKYSPSRSPNFATSSAVLSPQSDGHHVPLRAPRTPQFADDATSDAKIKKLVDCLRAKVDVQDQQAKEKLAKAHHDLKKIKSSLGKSSLNSQ
eukprot:gene5264-8036_t